MVASIVIGLIILVVALIIYREYRNEKRYQEERTRAKEEQKKRKLRPKVTTRPAHTKEEKPSDTAPRHSKLTQELPGTQKPRKESTQVTSPRHYDIKEETKKPEKPRQTPPIEKKEPLPVQAKELKPSVTPETQTELPKGDYPDFNYERLIEMGLSQEEALDFIHELIPQIKDQIPLIDEALKIPDFHKMERLTHSIKGSSTTIGTGGVSDLLVEYNTYLKTGKELPVAEAYQALLKKYFEKLKKQFPEG
ncbi:MAG: Hpt domain-containing protein [Sulfurovum sp.]|nr:Hpt domain-containing protein [Sulfurovum sp.]